ncbi:hypothetical protein [Bacillus sp. FJAT-27264]|uniref:hypothetical protein n=1 Tax=Paenibacillus sp. (strain DSM 101736 / FJAT-27264) TaxID=1850362 RepID=UPI001586DD34|nr:hypothetical protein [Bacillus sp. FJAT-27264]
MKPSEYAKDEMKYYKNLGLSDQHLALIQMGLMEAFSRGYELAIEKMRNGR